MKMYFYPRSPRGERRSLSTRAKGVSLFLSTLPARGATVLSWAQLARQIAISIHAPREGSDDIRHKGERYEKISIHAPREGSDPAMTAAGCCWTDFYPRSPRGERRLGAIWMMLSLVISIHAPREGSDAGLRRRPHHLRHFYPRSPRGERQGIGTRRLIQQKFLSTLPARGATSGRLPLVSNRQEFLSTLPARGATGVCKSPPPCQGHFYPRSPRGERRP